MADRKKRSLALIGSGGMLATMVRRAAPGDYDLCLFDLPDFDLTDRELVLRVMEERRPEIILNCAAYTDVDGCESNEETALRVNGEGPGHLAEAARRIGAVLVHISTDYVFDGTKETPYREDDPPSPQSAYGRSKLRGERAIRESGLERFFIVRTSWLYGPGGKNFVETIIRLAGERKELTVVADQTGTPTYTGDLAEAIYNLIELDASPIPPAGLYGIYHFSNEGRCSWYEFAREIVARLEMRNAPLALERVRPVTTEEYPLPARRPAWSVFSKERYRRVTGAEIPDWRSGLERYFAGRAV